jgi:hypothetical protein
MNMTIGPEVQIEAGIVRGVPRDERGVLAGKKHEERAGFKAKSEQVGAKVEQHNH